jgi:hypothetical protein
LEFPVGFLLGIGHESPLQQHPAAPSLPAQQAWAFLPFFFFLQQDMAASLQQPCMSQQASVFWLEFEFWLRVRAAAETARVAPMARVITSAWIFLILYLLIERIAVNNSAEVAKRQRTHCHVMQAHF